MLPNTIFRFFKADASRARNEEQDVMKKVGWMEVNLPFTMSTKHHHSGGDRLSFRSNNPLNGSKNSTTNNNIVGRQVQKKKSNKVSNISEMIQRVTPSCLLNISKPKDFEDEDENEHVRIEKVVELEMLIGQVFKAVSNMEGAYINMQHAHCPWDADKMRLADVRVVEELNRLGVLWESYRTSRPSGGRKWRLGAVMMKEAVAPYEAAVEGLKREVKNKDMIIVELKEKVEMATFVGINNGGRKMGDRKSSRKVCSISPVVTASGLELFEKTMGLVIDAAKSFTAMLLSLMRSAHWDIVAAVRSTECCTSVSNNSTFTATHADSIVGANHSKYALESFVNRRMFQCFDHETFNMDGSLSSLLHSDQYRQECFAMFKEMKDLDPVELLDRLPTCRFGKFCFKKYLNIVHPKMEESLFGGLEQQRQVLDGRHPRSRFYGEFLGLAKVVWLLHLLAFSLDPPVSHFEAGRGAGFHPKYMESVVKMNPRDGTGGVGGVGRFSCRQMVGFPVSPGFKLGDESVIKARVYLVLINGV